MVDFIESKRKKHSWLSPIVVACCKSHDPTRGQRCYSSISTYLLPKNYKSHVSGRGEGELVFTKHSQTITRENRRKTKKSNTFALTFSPRSLRVTSQIKLNPPSSPYCLDWTQWGLLLRRLYRLTHFDSHRKCKHVVFAFLVSPPTRRCGWECSPITLVA